MKFYNVYDVTATLSNTYNIYFGYLSSLSDYERAACITINEAGISFKFDNNNMEQYGLEPVRRVLYEVSIMPPSLRQDRTSADKTSVVTILKRFGFVNVNSLKDQMRLNEWIEERNELDKKIEELEGRISG